MKKKSKKIPKNKSFFFKDYSEAEINFNSKEKKQIKVSDNRITFLFCVFISLIFIFTVKIIYLSLSPKKVFFSQKETQFIKKRGDIIDSNGAIVATNIEIYSAGVNPKLIKDKDKEKFIINLRLTFPEIDKKKIHRNINSGKFFYLKKRLTEEERVKLWLLGNKAIIFEKKQFRIYPQKNLLSHILGQIDDDNNGISGIEKYFDEDLKKRGLKNTSLKLAIDTNLQHLIRKELISAEKHFKQTGSAAILMDVNTGEILSLVSLPDYDLNKRFSIKDEIYTNKITKGVYELGSVFKTFTLAAGLENNIIKEDTIFKNLKNKLNCDKYTITEHDELPKNLSVEQILIRSSNIGSIRIAQKIGLEKYKSFLNSLELFNTIKFDIEEVGTPLPFKWGKCKLATASYGHGISTTPLQLARAYAILGNGGYKVRPSILKKAEKVNKKKVQIISKRTSDKINSILRKVVSLDEGTANFANVDGYEIGGKTGTAVKYNSNAKLNTFVSLFPSSKPNYVLLVMLDEPKSAPNFVYNFPPSKKYPNGFKYKGERRNTSGWNTVVVAGKIIEKIGPILAINNLQASKNF